MLITILLFALLGSYLIMRDAHKERKKDNSSDNDLNRYDPTFPYDEEEHN